ncbi:MAG: TldD/PmbA family protein [Bacteroidales bacterium]
MITTKIDNKKELEIARQALDMVHKHGAQAGRISLNIGIQNSFSVLEEKLDRLQSANDRSLYIQIFVNGRYGAYSTNRLENRELSSFIKQAIEATKLLAPDTCRTLPSKELCYFGEGGDLEQFDPYILTMNPADKKAFAFEAAAEIYGSNKKLVSVSSEYGDVLDYQYMVDSQGFEGDSLQSSFTISVECSVKGRGDARPDGWWYECEMLYKNFSPKGCGKEALKRALGKLNPKKIESARMPMVVDRNCSSRLISPIISALSGSNIQQKNSFLIDSLGKKLFSDKMTFIDTPHQYGMTGSRYFDGDGLSTRPLTIIDKGVVNTYFINTYSANKMGIAPTIEGPSVPGFSLEDFPKEYRELTGEKMIPLIGRGIFVTGFNGGNCNIGTGDFSYGIEGFYFENGKILFPIKEMNITGNIIPLWTNLVFAGNDARHCTRWQIPALAFDSVDFTGL